MHERRVAAGHAPADDSWRARLPLRPSYLAGLLPKGLTSRSSLSLLFPTRITCFLSFMPAYVNRGTLLTLIGGTGTLPCLSASLVVVDDFEGPPDILCQILYQRARPRLAGRSEQITD